ncbi:MAG TPA: transposase [Lacunisphaera sp.]
MTAVPSKFPTRSKLPHVAPAWAKPSALFFVTVCTSPRGKNQLCHDRVAGTIFESVEFRQQRFDWHVTLLVLMPDHLHMLVAFPDDLDMRKIVTDWKSLLARKTAITWQRDFFDHRIRDHENWEQKAGYIRQNPVRGGLVSRVEEWKYVWEPASGGPGRSALPSSS